MADKKPKRKIVPVYCDQPSPKPLPGEDTWASMMNFSPERLGGLVPQESAPTNASNRRQPSAHTSQKVVKERDVPPPKRKHHRSGSNPLLNAAVPDTTPTRRKLKVGRLQFYNSLH